MISRNPSRFIDKIRLLAGNKLENN